MLVECRSDSEYAERPVALYWQGQRLVIVEILSRWRKPDGKIFRVRTTDQQLFELTYDLSADRWLVERL